MLFNYLKIGIRNLVKHKTYSIINMVGLTAGIACFLLIALFIQSELSFDRFHSKADRIHKITQIRVIASTSGISSERELPFAPGALAPILSSKAPELEHITRVDQLYGEQFVTLGDEGFYETKIMYAEPNISKVFDFDFVTGNPSKDLAEPFTVFLSESMAKKYVGEKNPVGKTIKIGGGNGENVQEYEIRGVFEDVPSESTIQFDFLISFQTLLSSEQDLENSWYRGTNLYALLKDDVTESQLNNRLSALSEAHKEASDNIIFSSMPLTDLHLYGKDRIGLRTETVSDISSVYLFSSIAFVVLLIACINYMNLSTARSAPRAREVGMRKVVGAYRGQLIQQFLSESMLLSSAAILAAVMILELILPAFNSIIGRELSFNLAENFELFMLIAGVGLGVGLLAGAYPAFVLSAFKPVQVLKNVFHVGSWNRIRKGLVVFQFSISALLILSTIIIKNQLSYMQNKSLGFDKEQVVSIPLKNALDSQQAAFKDALLKQSNVGNVSLSSSIPGASWGIVVFGSDDFEDYRGDVDDVVLHYFPADEDYISTMGIGLKEGRALSTKFGTDEQKSVLLNEAAVKKIGWDTAIGKTIKFGNDGAKTVVGVLEDFHFSSLKGDIEPLVVILSSENPQYVSLRIQAANVMETMNSLERVWNQFAPSYPFAYEFLDDKFDAMYREERRLGQLFSAFSGLAILISILGIFGLAAYTTERRAKEIGIRKVLGASVSGIVALLSKELLKLVIVSFLLAIPMAWYFMNEWLQDFAYRIEIGPGIFLLAALLTIGVALGTVSFQSIKTALSNPIDSLRSE